jgi:hypothetical protein
VLSSIIRNDLIGDLEELMRERIRATIEAIVYEELKGALGAAPSQRVGSIRAGYRHGKRQRAKVSIRMACEDGIIAAGNKESHFGDVDARQGDFG